MTGDQLLAYLTWTVFVVLFVLVTRTAVRQPLRANLNLVVLFGAPTAIILIGTLAALGLVEPGPLPNAINTALLLAISYTMLRLTNDFTTVPRWLLQVSTVVFVLLVVGSFVFAPPRPGWLSLAQVGYFTGLETYAALAFSRAAWQAIGITRRRMRAVALGSLLLGLTIGSTTLRATLPWMAQVTQVTALGAGLCYFLGFAPPLGLRRNWQEPELRAFLENTARLSRFDDKARMIHELEQDAAAAFGSTDARIGLWNDEHETLNFSRSDQTLPVTSEPRTLLGQAFLAQQPQFAAYEPGVRPSVQGLTPMSQCRGVLVAPISVGAQRFGVITVFVPHTPVVVDDDIGLLSLIARQIAILLDSRTLIDELARTRAEAEASRLKEDFLSAAAHDLKTPLTVVIGQAQRLERRMRADPEVSAYVAGVTLIEQSAQRLRRIVLDLLDAARAERGQIVNEREAVDLTELLREVLPPYNTIRHRCSIEGEEKLIGTFDRLRIQQLAQHLLDNAVLYSPNGGSIKLTVSRTNDMAYLSIRDQGIGIPAKDLPQVFERFFRGSNVDDRTFAGMGLSLFICRAIAEQHGGRIWATSDLGKGSVFHVTLPLAAQGAQHAAA